MGRRIQVNFQPEGIHGEVDVGTSVLEAARLFGVDISGICGGKQVCGKCKVIIDFKKNVVSPVSPQEEGLLTQEELSEGVRLACMTLLKGNSTIFIPIGSRVGSQRLQTWGQEIDFDLMPLIKKISVRVPQSTVSQQSSDADLLEKVLIEEGFKNPKFSLDIVRMLPITLRKGSHRMIVTLNGENEIIDLESGSAITPMYGLAVDIGTTKVACYLHDLKNGELVESSSMMNPQIFYGEDILTRISHAFTYEKGLKDLHQTIVEGLNKLIEKLLGARGILKNHLYEMTVVGNTVMHHLFLDVTPRHLAVAPFSPSISGSLNIKARELGIGINPLGNIHMLPIVSGFVGSDCLAAILATGLQEKNGSNLLLDVGTNTEIVLSVDRTLNVCSCASGPAFEGAHIRNGMRASEGAIERAWIDVNTMDVEYTTIDRGKAKGICGSGVVDLIAEMLRAGIIDTTGRIYTKPSSNRFKERGGVSEFIVEFGSKTVTGNDIVITQKDVREIQKAKAAIYTGSSILLKKNFVKPDEIENVYVAGAFGNYLDPENIRTIGMFPDFAIDRIIGVGNAAGTGSRMVLLSKNVRDEAINLSKNINYIELAAEPNFMAEYTNALNLPHKNLSLFPLTMKKLSESNFQVKG